MNHETRRAEERVADAAEALLEVAKRFIQLYGAGGPESAFEDLYTEAVRVVQIVEPDEEP